MQNLNSTIIAILRKYMSDPASYVVAATKLGDLGIDQLDLPMICLDIEDVAGVQITFDDEMDGFATVSDLIVCVAARLEAKAVQALRTPAPRAKRGWMSAPAARHR